MEIDLLKWQDFDCYYGQAMWTQSGKRAKEPFKKFQNHPIQKLNCDLNAPAIDCGCHPTAVAGQFISGGAGKAECLARGKKGSKGSTWKLSCDGQPTKDRFQYRLIIEHQYS